MTAAEVIEPLVASTLGSRKTLHVTCWDGSEFGPPDAPAQVVFVKPRAIRWLLWAPSELGFARAYVAGDIRVEGDMLAGLAALEHFADPESGPTIAVDAATKRAIATAALRLGVVGPPPRPPAEESRLRGGLHSKARDAAAIAHHYDVGNAFYELILGPSMVYSCGYWPTGPSDSFDLEQAQLAKCDLVVRKLGLTQGEAQSRCRRPTTGGDGCTPSSSGRRPSEGPARDCPRPGAPHHPVDHHPVVHPLATTTRRPIWQQRLQQRPLPIRQVMSLKHP